jgi:hypothetical protein
MVRTGALSSAETSSCPTGSTPLRFLPLPHRNLPLPLEFPRSDISFSLLSFFLGGTSHTMKLSHCLFTHFAWLSSPLHQSVSRQLWDSFTAGPQLITEPGTEELAKYLLNEGEDEE